MIASWPWKPSMGEGDSWEARRLYPVCNRNEDSFFWYALFDSNEYNLLRNNLIATFGSSVTSITTRSLGQ